MSFFLSKPVIRQKKFLRHRGRQVPQEAVQNNSEAVGGSSASHASCKGACASTSNFSSEFDASGCLESPLLQRDTSPCSSYEAATDWLGLVGHARSAFDCEDVDWD